MYKTPNFNQACDRCTLKNPNNPAVSGQSEVSFNQVKLIIVSAYPGSNEIQTGMSLAPQPKETKHKSPSPTAGGYMRASLSLFDADPNIPDEYKPFEKFVYFTNALKCSPQRGRDKVNIAAKHISICRSLWLDQEIDLFPAHVPILLAASEAVKSLLPDVEGGLYANRRKVVDVKGHPAVVTFNPIEAERGAMKWIDDFESTLSDLTRYYTKYKSPPKGNPIKGVFWKPAPIGSTTWHWRQDMELIKRLVIESLSLNASN